MPIAVRNPSSRSTRRSVGFDRDGAAFGEVHDVAQVPLSKGCTRCPAAACIARVSASGTRPKDHHSRRPLAILTSYSTRDPLPTLG
eukprot:scaffold101767_cov60-Phaeocystis_antarctica.AAC.2